jgi:hypothetical protein
MVDAITKTGERYFIKTALLLCLLHSSGSYATVTIAESKKSPAENKVTTEKKNTLLVKNNEVEQYQIEGYADSAYVRFVVETTKNNLVAGQMIQGDHHEHISGEIIDGTLHLYGSGSTHYTVILAE